MLTHRGNIVRRIDQKVTYRPERSKCNVSLGLRSVGRAFFPPYQKSAERSIDFVQVLWTISGKGWVRIGQKTMPVESGWIAVCLPESVHCLSTKKAGWKYRWFTVDGEFALPLMKALEIPAYPFLAGACPSDTFTQLEETVMNPSPTGEKFASAKAYQFITRISCIRPEAAGIKSGQAVKKVLDMIGEDVFNPEMNVEAISRRVGMSRFSIHRIFKNEMGMSPKSYIDSVRLQKMLSLLRETSLSLEQIALKSGFANANYLTKFFRKKMKCTPTEFRDEIHMP